MPLRPQQLGDDIISVALATVSATFRLLLLASVSLLVAGLLGL